MEDHKLHPMVLMDLDPEPPIKITSTALEITGLNTTTNMATVMLLEITGLRRDTPITMLKPELTDGVKLPLYPTTRRVLDLVGELKRLMLKVTSTKATTRTETTGLMPRTDMVREVLEADMVKEEKPTLDQEPWVLKMPMPPPTPTEVDLRTVPEERKDLWPNLNTETKNMLGTIASIVVITNMVIGTLATIGTIKLNLTDIPRIWLKEEVGLLDKLTKTMELVLLVREPMVL